MLAKATDIWESLRASYWFLPTLMSLLAVLLSIVTIQIDRRVTLEDDPLFGMIYSGGPEGSRSVLSVIAGSMITVTGIVFSITIVALSLASSQLGPRILRTFMRDRGNQFVFGTFIATFVYCLLVLRTIRSDSLTFVPSISVTVGIAFSLLSLGVLIYFIHHIAQSIQADHVVANVGKELKQSIEQQLKAGAANHRQGEGNSNEQEDVEQHPWTGVYAQEEGYVRTTAERQFLELARKHDLLIRLEFQPGDFIVERQPLARVWGSNRRREEVADEVRKACTLGPTRTQTQDAFFLVDQLVQIALRALSPGINDPLTAMNCIEYLGAALVSLAESGPLSPHSFDASGRLRLIKRVPSFERALRSSFARIRQNAGSSVIVMAALLEGLALLLSRACTEEYRSLIRAEMDSVLEIGSNSLHSTADKRVLEETYSRVTAI
jgi:uncharacterized membrane protein